MKNLFPLFLLSSLLLGWSCQNQKVAIDDEKGFLKNWNDALNSLENSKLATLYAESVNYYGQELSKEQVLEEKKKFFKRYPNFQQEVTVIGSIEYVDEVTSKIVYSKKTSFGTVNLETASQLVLQRKNESWEIIAEQDVAQERQNGEEILIEITEEAPAPIVSLQGVLKKIKISTC